MSYTSGSHTVFHHRYHIVWITKYRYKVLEGALRERIRTIIRQVCRELGVQIVSGVLSSREHVHMFVEIPPHIAVSDFVRRVKGRSSHRVRMEFPDLRKRTGDAISGRGAPSPPPAATSRTMSYIFKSTNLPASAHRRGARRRPRPLAARIDPVPRRGKRRFRSGGLRFEGLSLASFRPGPRTG